MSVSTRTNMTKVTVIGGEGIGPEVTGQSARVLAWFATNRKLPIQTRDAEYGITPYLATGEVMPADTRDAVDEADAIVFGATGGPETVEVPEEARQKASLLSMRKSLDLYANVRPIVADPSLFEAAPLKARGAQGRRLRHRARTQQRHLFR